MAPSSTSSERSARHEIALEGLEFFGRHGYYAAETEVGNRFTVDLRVETDFRAAGENDLAGTIDYGDLYALVATVMTEPQKLLEALCLTIVRRVEEQFPAVLSCEVSVAKHNPPLGGLCQRSRVTIRQQFNR